METRKILLSLFTILAIIFMPGCEDKDSSSGIMMNVSTKSINVGEECLFYVIDQSSGEKYEGAISWSIEEWVTNGSTQTNVKSPDQIACIDQSGLVKGLSDGVVIVRATLPDGRYTIATLVVGDPTALVPDIESVYIERKLTYIDKGAIDTLNIWIAPQYGDETIFPVSAQLYKMNADGTVVERDENDPSTLPASTFHFLKYKQYMEMQENGNSNYQYAEGNVENELPDGFTDGTVYVLALNSAAVKEDLIATVTVGDLSQNIEIHVDFSLYMSFDPINPSNPGENLRVSEQKVMATSNTETLQFNLYIKDSGNTGQSYELVEEALMNEENYTLTSLDGVELGTPVITPDANTPNAYVVSMNVTTGKDTCCGELKINILGRELSVALTVENGFHMSFAPIDPSDPESFISASKSMLIETGKTETLYFNIYVKDLGNTGQSYEVVEEAIMNKDNYTLTSLEGVELGTPVITPNANTPNAYIVSIDVTAGEDYGYGELKINILERELSVVLTVDNGEMYERLYISFTRPNTYTIPPMELTLTKDMEVFSDEHNVVIRVYHDIAPDTRAKYIDWDITQSGDRVITPIGRQVSSTGLYTDFEYAILGTPGKTVIDFNVYNPQGELGGEYAEYLNQTITATVTVVDRGSIGVNSVTFNPDEIEMSAAAIPIEAVIDPIGSSIAWPIEYSIESLQNGAAADIYSSLDDYDNTTYQLKITKAGIIKVKAEAGPVGNRKSDILTVTAKLKLSMMASRPLEISKVPSFLYVGETGQVEKQLHANYAVDESSYTWTSSAPDILSVDQNGNVTAKAKGSADISVSITDDYGNTATDSRTITVRMLDIDADISTLPADYYVVYEQGHREFWVDTEAGSSDYYTFSLNRDILSANGTYTAGVNFSGTVTFPGSKGATQCEITGGTITVSNGVARFNLTVSYGSTTGKIIGSKPILVL